jgi:hypothetical protein
MYSIYSSFTYLLTHDDHSKVASNQPILREKNFQVFFGKGNLLRLPFIDMTIAKKNVPWCRKSTNQNSHLTGKKMTHFGAISTWQ